MTSQLVSPVKTHLISAERLQEETTMPLKWIAAELHMGTWTHLNRLLHNAK